VLIHTARELGLLIREARRRANLTQAVLAERIGVSRKWVIDLEGGKTTAEVGRVLQALRALDLSLDVRPDARGAATVDLDAIVDRPR
jgi:HTH-type transcriptional regulator/antitoxin HipB